jgi:8-hydroxy-5-deazaflavin:NADPH oxidoreductase
MNASRPRIAVVGGTGQLGAALARRLARAGYAVVIGSRDVGKAEAAAAALSAALGVPVAHASNAEAATRADVVLLTVPFASQAATLADIGPALAGKILLDTTVPLVPPKVMRVQLPPEDSAAVAAQRRVGPDVRVISGFHNVAAHKLATDETVDCDVLIFGDERAARDVGVELASACGLRGLHGGALANSAAAEALTSILIFMNRHYGVDGAGIRITGQLNG